MSKSIFALGIAALATVANATTVAVLELGKGGVVRRAAASPSASSPQGVMSFWRSLHEAGSDGEPRKEKATQFPGMTVVPDLFNRANGGVVVGIVGDAVELEHMPHLSSVIQDAVGQIQTEGNHGQHLLGNLASKPLKPADFEKSLESKANAAVTTSGNKLEAVSVQIDEKLDAAGVDASIDSIIKKLVQDLDSSDSTIVLHIVIDNDNNRRRLDGANNGGNAYYDYSEIMGDSNYKTIFQIQYYNIVLWTALGLAGILLAVNLMTMYMPLMPDTLLFGESAKMVAE